MERPRKAQAALRLGGLISFVKPAQSFSIVIWASLKRDDLHTEDAKPSFFERRIQSRGERQSEDTSRVRRINNPVIP